VGKVGLTTLPLYVPIVLKSGSLNRQEPSGPVQACNGIALPLPLPLLKSVDYSIEPLVPTFYRNLVSAYRSEFCGWLK
jgi:hypothetical protein